MLKCKLLILTAILALLSFTGYTQANTVTAKVLKASQSLYVKGQRIDSISTDATFSANSNNVIPTQAAIATYIAAHPGTVLSVVNMSSLGTFNTSGLTGGATINVSGFYSINDGGGGSFIWNATSTATPVQGWVVQGPFTSGRWFRQWDGYHVNGLSTGMVGDGSTDNTAAEQVLFNLQPNIEIDIPSPAVSYITKNNVYLNTSGVHIKGQDKYGTLFVQPIGNTYTGGGHYRTMWMYGNIRAHGGVNNISIENINLLNQDTVTVLGGAVVQPGCLLAFQDTAFLHLVGMADSNLSLINCVISAPNGRGEGVFYDAYRNNYGGIIKNIYIKGVDFINISGAALQLLNTNTFGDYHMSDFYVGYCKFSNCGNGYPANGFGASFGGYGVRGLVENNNLHHIAGIGLECGGPSYVTIKNNTLDSSYNTIGSGIFCAPWTVNNINGNGGGPGYGNKLINNTVLDSVANNVYIYNQVNFYSSGNYVHMFNVTNGFSYTGGIGSDVNSTFTNDVWWMSGGENTVSALRMFNYGGSGPSTGNGISSGNTFINETIIGDPGDRALLTLEDSAQGNNFYSCTYKNGPSLTVYNDGTSFNNFVGGVQSSGSIGGVVALNIITVSTSYSVSPTDYTIIYTGTTGSITLPSVTGLGGRVIVLKHTSTGSIALSGTIRSGDPTSLLATGTSGANLTLQCDGTQWIAIGSGS